MTTNNCLHPRSIVLGTYRDPDDQTASMYRRRQCKVCFKNFITVEQPHDGVMPRKPYQRASRARAEGSTTGAQDDRMAAGAALLSGLLR